MNAPPVHPDLSPDAYAVLIDVAKQPDSILLTVDPRKASRELLEPSDLVQPTAAFLTSAERHLLAAHRDEVGRWLRNLVNVELRVSPALRDRIHTLASPTARLRLPSRRDCIQALHNVDDGAARVLLTRLVEHSAAPTLPIEALEHLTTISTRFSRSPNVLLHAGMAHFARGLRASARDCFLRLTRARGIYVRLGWEWLGVISFDERNFAGAAECYARACATPHGTVAAGVYWALNALRSPQGIVGARPAMDWLVDQPLPTPDDVAGLAKSLSLDGWVPPKALAESLGASSPTLGEVLRAIA